eukprot:6188722-Pleurochrysis_carterae.AAC.2
MHDHVGQIKGPAAGARRLEASLYATNTVVQNVAVLQPSMPGRTVNGQIIVYSKPSCEGQAGWRGASGKRRGQ